MIVTGLCVEEEIGDSPTVAAAPAEVGGGSGPGGGNSPRLRLPEKFPFSALPKNAAGIQKWFVEMEQKIIPHWPNMVEGYAWMLHSVLIWKSQYLNSLRQVL